MAPTKLPSPTLLGASSSLSLHSNSDLEARTCLCGELADPISHDGYYCSSLCALRDSHRSLNEKAYISHYTRSYKRDRVAKFQLANAVTEDRRSMCFKGKIFKRTEALKDHGYLSIGEWDFGDGSDTERDVIKDIGNPRLSFNDASTTVGSSTTFSSTHSQLPSTDTSLPTSVSVVDAVASMMGSHGGPTDLEDVEMVHHPHPGELLGTSTHDDVGNTGSPLHSISSSSSTSSLDFLAFSQGTPIDFRRFRHPRRRRNTISHGIYTNGEIRGTRSTLKFSVDHSVDMSRDSDPNALPSQESERVFPPQSDVTPPCATYPTSSTVATSDNGQRIRRQRGRAVDHVRPDLTGLANTELSPTVAPFSPECSDSVLNDTLTG